MGPQRSHAQHDEVAFSLARSDLLRSSKSQLKIGKIMDQEVQKLKPTGLLDGHLEA